MTTPDDREVHKVLLEHQRYMEGRAQSTLNNFLVANSFVLVAWATLYERGGMDKEFGAADVIMILLAFVGYLGGLGWAMVGARNWEYAQRLVGKLREMGSSENGCHRPAYWSHFVIGIKEPADDRHIGASAGSA